MTKRDDDAAATAMEPVRLERVVDGAVQCHGILHAAGTARPIALPFDAWDALDSALSAAVERDEARAEIEALKSDRAWEMERANEAARLSADARDLADARDAAIAELRKELRDAEDDRTSRDAWAVNVCQAHDLDLGDAEYDLYVGIARHLRSVTAELAAEKAAHAKTRDSLKAAQVDAEAAPCPRCCRTA
jgi:hypothetical protein